MKSKTQILTAALLGTLVSILWVSTTKSSIPFPQPGNDGAPSINPPYQTCGQCHSGAPGGNATPKVDFTFSDGVNTTPVSNFQYELNKQYVISYTPLTNSKRYGFQMSALKTGNTNGGTFSLIPSNTGTTYMLTIPSGTYVSHHNASSFHNWSFYWTSPATDVGDITFYYVFNASDSSNTQTGDTIYAGSSVIHPAPSAIQNVQAVSDLLVYPNPVSGMMNISFNLIQDDNIQMCLYSLDGKKVKTLLDGDILSTSFKRSFELSDCPPGIYLLTIKAGGNNSFRKVVIE